MSNEVRDIRDPGWLWADRGIISEDGAELTPYGIAVYVALCAHANERGQSFPSVATLAQEIGCSETKARACLDMLQAMGWIRIEPRTREDGSQTSNMYYLLPSPHKVIPAPHVVHPPVSSGAPERESVKENKEIDPSPTKPLIERYFGMTLSGAQVALWDFLAESYSLAWFEDALKETVAQGGGQKMNIKYVRKVLENWKLEGHPSTRNGNGHKPERPVVTTTPASKRRDYTSHD